MYSIPKSWRFSGTQERAPIHLIPTKEKEKPPRFSQQKTFTDIEEELRKPVTERQLPTRDIQAQMRNFGSMPDKEKIKSTKGKLKASIKRMHMDTESLQKSALKTVEYKSLGEMESEETDEDAHDRFAGKRLSHKERRKLRLAERTHTIISEVLLKKFSAHPHLRPTEMGLTRVEAAIDLKSVTIMWLPHNPEKKELIEKSLEKSKGQLRWYLTERLSYLRHSPQLNFQYDEILLESDRTERLLDEIAS